MSVFDIWDSAQLTVLVQGAVDRVLGEGRERVAGQFAPVVGTEVDKIARERVKIKAVGRGSVIADDATPPIYRPETKLVQEEFELLRISEMTSIEESLRRQLEINGTDQFSQERKRRAGVDIVTRGRAIQVRNENQSDWITMQGIVFGKVPITLANPPEGTVPQEYEIDYEFPASHLTQVTTSWADLTNGKPVTDLRAWQTLLRAATGDWGIHIYLSSDVMQYILNSKEVRDSLTPNVGPQYISTEDHVKNLLNAPQRVQFHQMDEGWYEETAGYLTETDESKTRWLPKDRVLMTTEDPYRGERIAQMFDGMVPVQTDWDTLDYRGPGAQSYAQLIQGNLTLMMRNEMRRFLMIEHPERIVSAKVVL